MHTMLSALVVGGAASLSGADIVYDATLRWIAAEAELSGPSGGREFFEDLSEDPGFYSNSLHALVERGESGRASGLASNVSDYSASSASAQGTVVMHASTDGSFSEAIGGGLSFAAGDFSVTEEQVFRINAAILWSNGPEFCVVKLRETNGVEHFVLEATGMQGEATAEVELTLEPGKQYSLFGIVAGSAFVEAGDMPEQGYAEFSFNLQPVPAPSALAPLMLGAAASARRRRR